MLSALRDGHGLNKKTIHLHSDTPSSHSTRQMAFERSFSKLSMGPNPKVACDLHYDSGFKIPGSLLPRTSMSARCDYDAGLFFPSFFSTINCFHGTIFSFLFSLVQYGFRPGRSNSIMALVELIPGAVVSTRERGHYIDK